MSRCDYCGAEHDTDLLCGPMLRAHAPRTAADADTIATLTRQLEEARAQLAERTRERDELVEMLNSVEDLENVRVADQGGEPLHYMTARDIAETLRTWRAGRYAPPQWKARAESAERQVEKMRERLMAIRDSTYRNAITLRGMADAAIAAEKGERT